MAELLIKQYRTYKMLALAMESEHYAHLALVTLEKLIELEEKESEEAETNIINFNKAA